MTQAEREERLRDLAAQFMALAEQTRELVPAAERQPLSAEQVEDAWVGWNLLIDTLKDSAGKRPEPAPTRNVERSIRLEEFILEATGEERFWRNLAYLVEEIASDRGALEDDLDALKRSLSFLREDEERLRRYVRRMKNRER